MIFMKSEKSENGLICILWDKTKLYIESTLQYSMSKMIKFGNGLQGKYSGNPTGNTKTTAEKKTANSDHEALMKHAKTKRKAREERADVRESLMMAPDKALKKVESGDDALLNGQIKNMQKTVKAKTNVIARQYGLAEPNNPEALAHDRLHCATCDRTLDAPNAHKQAGLDGLFEDSEVRIMCCWCFGKFDDSEIKSTMYTGLEANAKIRLAVYNPEESTREEVESLTDSRRIYLKCKLKKWEQDTSLIGKIKHVAWQDADTMENIVRDQAPTRYTACTL